MTLKCSKRPNYSIKIQSSKFCPTKKKYGKDASKRHLGRWSTVVGLRHRAVCAAAKLLPELWEHSHSDSEKCDKIRGKTLLFFKKKIELDLLRILIFLCEFFSQTVAFQK